MSSDLFAKFVVYAAISALALMFGIISYYWKKHYLFSEHRPFMKELKQKGYTQEEIDFLIGEKKAYRPIDLYLTHKFNLDQMHEIKRGTVVGVDYTKYADPSIPAEKMFKMRKELEKITEEEKKGRE